MRHNIGRQTENVMLERVSFAQDDTGDYVARARALRPLIAAHAARIEQEREIAPEVLSVLHDAQLFRMLVPKSCDSGIKHAEWLGCHCPVVEADGTPRLGSDGKPAERTMLIPKASAKIKDIWRVVGLKGTGSDNYTIDDLFVPDAYTFTRESAADRRETGPLYRFTTFHLYGTGFAAIALGLARGALDDFVALAATKIPKTKTFVLRDNAVIQSQVALAEAKLASSRSFLLQI